MADFWIGNVETGTSAQEIKEFLTRYGFPPFDGVKHIPGKVSRPAVVVKFEGLGPEMLRRL